MKFRRSALATAFAALLGLGAAGQASADVYAGSSLTIQDLLIRFKNASGADASANVDIRNFSFTTTNTAVLNNTGVLTTDVCSGTFGVGNNDCGAGPVIDAAAANAPASSFNRSNNQVSGDGTFTWFTLGGGNWSNADSVIYTSELTSFGANPTHTDQIAESNISTATSASASSEIQSVTGFTLQFTVGGVDPVSMVLSFLADPDMRAQILNDLGISFGAQANMAVSMTLQKDQSFTGASWSPDGTSTNNCIVGGGVTCVENADASNLNLTIGTSTNNSVADHSYDPNSAGLGGYGISLAGLTVGNWTLTLSAKTSTNLTRRDVPEPSTLALAGLAMLGIGVSLRRSRRV